jgi:TRAP-type C4-dicarboxylate transport system permease small subunit
MIFFERLASFNKRASRLMLFISVLILAFATIIACLNMILRPFGYPISSSFEILGLSGALITCLGLTDSFQKGNHIAVDLFVKKLPEKAGIFFITIGNILSFFIFALICYKFFLMGYDSLKTGELTESLKLPLFIMFFLLFAGFLTITAELFLNIFNENQKI